MSELDDRVAKLEGDLARALLLLQSLAEVCVSKGLITATEISQMAAQLDHLDGVRDGKLDPTSFWPTEGNVRK